MGCTICASSGLVTDPPGRLSDIARDQPALDQELLENVDEDVEHRAGQRLRQRVLVLPAGRELRQLDVVAGEPDLIVRRKFGETVELVESVEIAARLLEQVLQ